MNPKSFFYTLIINVNVAILINTLYQILCCWKVPFFCNVNTYTVYYVNVYHISTLHCILRNTFCAF